jgi:hypothetical protein
LRLEKLEEPVYLGDGLYAEFDGFQIKLYAYNGERCTDRVYLNPEVLTSFFAYVKELKRFTDRETG